MACLAALCLSATASAQDGDSKEPPEEWRRFTAKLSAGPTVHAFYGRPIYGADLTVALGGNAFGHPGHYYACLRGLIGQTANGLDLEHLRVCGVLEWSIGRVRLGITPEIGFFLVHRATDDDVMGSLSFGLDAQVSVDLVQFFEDAPPAGALYLALSGGFDALWFTDPLTHLGGGTLALGVRF